MVDYIANYLGNIRKRRVFPDVKPGYMRSLLPESAPEDGESFHDIFEDVEKVIMPGITHWQSPQMHAYFPALNSPASLLGDMLADGLGCLAFTWASSPACTELEMVVMDWLAKIIGLPAVFLHSSNCKGGGVIQTTASESTLIGLLAARTQMFQNYREKDGQINEADLNTRLVGYTSDQVCATLGTTGACAFDDLKEIGQICDEENLWLHVDAAYAGSAFVCPEFRHWMDGIEYADSFAFNPSKWLMVHFDCTAMWVKNSERLHRTFNVDPLYLKHENTGLAVDFTHWQISLSKRFRALKLWFVLRNYGIKGLQKHIRHGVKLAKEFEELVQDDDRFEVPAKRHLGLVTFRVKGENELTENLLKKINSSGRLHCVPSSLKGKYVIRFTVTSPQTTSRDIQNDWSFIQIMCSQILNESPSGRRPISMAEIKKRNPSFGTSLLLSNSPMTPKFMNASYVAIFEPGEDIKEFLDRNNSFRIVNKDSPVLQRRLKGLVRGERQFSLDSHIDLMVAANSKKSHRKSVTSIEEHSLGEDSDERSSPDDASRCDKCGQIISL
ncbi:histidine decarboxylase [Trichonephila inaurata madagascariensis]|uniref:Histidine decarboxylase n=1 Tax=Trichonephila inaurata madagascariensis TaxID=2747483 RepID=A0A8X6XTX7_9ARAC|nr:histidine decarboxylase [Trichonephila inaurata madagascariensis]